MSQGIESATAQSGGENATTTRVIEVMADAPLALPNDNALLTGDYVRAGDDLRIEGLDGSVTILDGYFADGFTPDLIIGGAVLKGQTIAKIAREPRDSAGEENAAWGSLDDNADEGGWSAVSTAVEQAEETPLFAQADAAAAAAPGDLGAAILGAEGAIAQITEAYGHVEIIRADGARVTAGPGTPIFEDDVLLTDAGGSVGVTFVDGMSFSLGESAKMVFDAFAYDPANHSGGGVLSVLQGAFSFISGEAAHTAEDALMIETPTMTIGVRGTKVVSQINPDGQTSRIAIMSEESGRIGKIMVKTDKGETILDKPNTMVEVTSRFEAPSDQREMSSAEAAQYFGEALSVLPAPTDIFRPEMIEAGYNVAAAAMAQAAEATSGAGRAEQSPAPTAQQSVSDPAPAPAAARTVTPATAEGVIVEPAAAEAPPAPPKGATAGKKQSAAETLDALREVEEEMATDSASTATAAATPNAAPVATGLAAANGAEDAAFVYDASTAFTDPEGESLTYSALLADGSPLPAWLSVDPTTGALSGTPDNGDVGALSIAVTARDPHGATASTGLTLTVANVNDTPTVVSALTSIVNAEDAVFTLDASTAFADDDSIHGDSLAYSATLADGTALPSWLSINSETGVLSGTPDNSQVGVITVKVTATDASAAAATSSFSLTVTNVNDAPTVVAALSDLSTNEDALFSLDATTAFADADSIHGDSLTYSATLADGSELPGWLSIDAATGVLSGTPDNAQVGVFSVKVTATDGSAQAVSSTFDLTVANVNDAPTVVSALSNVSTAEDALFSLDTTAAFVDADSIHGDSLTYSATLADGSALPGWLTINAATGVLSGTPDNAQVGVFSVKVIATDASAQAVSSTFDLTVANVNDAPTVVAALSDLSANEDALFSLDATAAFADADIAHGDSLTYTATLSDGSALPGWLSINTTTGVLSGTPLQSDVGAISIKVFATDGAAQSASSTFTLTVANTNDAPTVSAPLSDVTTAEDAAFSIDATGAFSDVDTALGDVLGYSATLADGSALPAWLSFNASTGVLSGTPSDGDVGTISVRISTFDLLGLGASSTFDLTVTNVNDAPVLNNVATPTLSDVVENATAPVGNTVSQIVVDGSITDADGAPVEAIALTGVDDANGTWEYSIDGGASFSAAGPRWDANALLLDGSAILRFVPDAGYTGGASFAFRAWDKSTGSNGDTGVDTTSNGGTTAFSSATDQAHVTVSAPAVDQGARLDLGGEETTVNTTTADRQTAPDVGALANGGHVVVWQSSNQDGDGEGIYGQRYAADGSKVGSEFLVNTTTSLDQTEPQVIGLSNGGFAVVWTHDSGGLSQEGVLGQLYDANGSAVGGTFVANTSTLNEQSSPAATALSNGGFVVSWTSLDAAGVQYDVFTQRFSADGSKVGGETRVNDFSLDNQVQPAIATLADGGWVVSWTAENQDGDGKGVFAQRYNADGTTSGGETQINTTTALDQNDPAVTGLDDGGYVITWVSVDQDGDGKGVYFQRYDSDGVAQGPETRANATTAAAQHRPDVESLADGGFIIAWQSRDQDGSHDGVYAQRYDASGATVGGETLLNVVTTEQQHKVSLALREDGSLATAWASKVTGDENIHTRVFEANSGPELTAVGGIAERTVAAGATETGALAATDADGDALVYSILNNGAKGTASIDASTGEWSYQANGGESGSDSVSYQVSDGNGGVDTLTLTFAIS